MKRIFRKGLALAATAGLVCGAAVADAQQINLERAVISPAGGTSSDGTVTMQYTVAQPVAGTASNGDITGAFGFRNQAPSISSVDGILAGESITAIRVMPSPLVSDGTVEIDLSASGLVDVQLYDAGGEQAAHLFRGERSSGRLSLPISTEGLASGTYFIVVRTPGALRQIPLTIAK